jgi:hypothetical protein
MGSTTMHLLAVNKQRYKREIMANQGNKVGSVTRAAGHYAVGENKSGSGANCSHSQPMALLAPSLVSLYSPMEAVCIS